MKTVCCGVIGGMWMIVVKIAILLSTMHSLEYRRAVIAVYEFTGSMRHVSSMLDISVASICRWSKCSKFLGWPPKDQKITVAMQEAIRARLAAHPTTTSIELVRLLRDGFKVAVSRQLVNLVLRKKLGFSWKRTRKRGPKGASWPDDRVAEFKQQFLAAYRRGTLSSWDESGFDLRCHPLYGYALRGHRAIVNVPKSKCKGKNSDRHHSLVMAMHMDGGHHAEVLTGPVGGERFAAFVASTPFPPGTVVLLDNHSMHKTRAVRLEAARRGYSLLYTPAYSPEFNPIELMFGATKNFFYRLRYSDDGITNVGDAVVHCLGAAARPDCITGCFHHVASIIQGTKRP